MSEIVTITLTSAERDELVRGLVLLRHANGEIETVLPTLEQTAIKLARASGGPHISVGVHGGQVQWTLGNPFPIRVCDYDGDDCELPDLDERNQRCRIWFEPADEDWAKTNWRKLPVNRSV